MHSLRIRVRQSRSFVLSSSFLLSELDLLHLTFFPHVAVQSVDWLLNSVPICFLFVFHIVSLSSFLLRMYVAVSLYK